MKADVSPITADTAINLQWRSIIAGAVCASALAYVLHAFAGAIGLSLSLTAPTWRDASWALVLLSGLYILLVALASYSFGAYIAARLRAPVTSAADSTEFRDGMHGLVVWARATLLTVLIVLATAQVASRLVAPSGAPSTSAAGENLLAYDLDRLFRSDRRPQGAESNMNYTRTEAGRILLSASSHRGMQADDRTYLVRLVTAMTGLAPAEAQCRVNQCHCPNERKHLSCTAQRRHFRLHGRRVCTFRRCCRLVCRLCRRPGARRPRITPPIVGLGPTRSR